METEELKIAKVFMPFVLRRFRDAAGLSQQELCDRVGISKGFYSSLECGKRAPNLDMMVRISLALGVMPGELVNAMWEEWRKSTEDKPEEADISAWYTAAPDKGR